VDFKYGIRYYCDMRIKFHVSTVRGFFYFSLLCFVSLVGLQAEDRPVPRKPFVAKSGATRVAPKPFTSSNSTVAPPQSSQLPKPSGGAEILTITRSHKPPTQRPIAPDQGSVPTVSTKVTDPTATSATGATAQVGRIIESK
jgi:hypothetical protein